VLQAILDPMNAKRFVDHCRSKRRGLSAQTAEEIVKVLRDVKARGGNAVAAIDLSIKRGWTTVDVDWLANAGFKFGSGQATISSPSFDWSAALDVYRSGTPWPHGWGPEPGTPGCRVPADLLVNFQRERAA